MQSRRAQPASLRDFYRIARGAEHERAKVVNVRCDGAPERG
jgi:hypothetical protein